ncbi:hypothetical protein CLV59_102615 [Chitinophaga dinghuensis]|uniref:Uncharacterized protein n=1 Tax=Chitinophaga dinghuensis TaxID=1539050 RepID=A0A327W8V8_9BACT|nr:hypothetical protein CLV59_102615 [Chitinophaga dinghuensis]
MKNSNTCPYQLFSKPCINKGNAEKLNPGGTQTILLLFVGTGTNE